jgi:hypothetical protein
MLIDKICGTIGNRFGKIVRHSRVLEDLAAFPPGSHEVMMSLLTLNAGAALDPLNRPIYSYHLGTPLALFDVAMTAAADARFHPEIPFSGNSVQEYRQLSTSSFLSYEYLRSFKPKDVKPFRPHRLCQEPRRLALGNALFDAATRFVAFHEQGHFIRGHLHYVNGESHGLKLSELPAPGYDRAAEPSVMCAFELDADGFAAGVAFSDLLSFPEILAPETAGTEAVQSTEDYVRLFLAGFACLFAVLARGDRYLSSVTTHPSAAVRMVNVWEYFVYSCRQALGREMPVNDELFSAALADVNTVFEILEVPQVNEQNLRAFTDRSALPEEDKVFEELWKTKRTLHGIEPYLRQYSEHTLRSVEAARAKKPNN